MFEQAQKAAARESGQAALLVVDVDHFKRCNDRYGHAVGDMVLKGIAKCLMASVNRPQDLAARVGGEEFAVLMPGTDRAGAARVAERIHRAVAGFGLPSAGIAPGGLSVSIGLAIGRGTAEDLYVRADAALYDAKRSGRNQTCCAAEEAAAEGLAVGAESIPVPEIRKAG